MLVLLCGTALWAQDDFNPTSPDEPGGPLVSKSKLTLVANPEDAAYSLWGEGSYEVGAEISVSAEALQSPVYPQPSSFRSGPQEQETCAPLAAAVDPPSLPESSPLSEYYIKGSPPGIQRQRNARA